MTTLRRGTKPLIKSIHTRHGASLSVQASRSHYCNPRQDDPYGGYDEVEVGFPSITPQASMMQYAEYPDKPTDTVYTVYGWVPVHIVRDYIDIHGGFATPEDERRFNNLINGLFPTKEESYR